MPRRPASHANEAPLASALGNARRLAQSIAGTLRMARAFASAGRSIDLVGLNEPIGLLCAKSLDLPPEEGRQMRTVLIALRREIDAISEALGHHPTRSDHPIG